MKELERFTHLPNDIVELRGQMFVGVGHIYRPAPHGSHKIDVYFRAPKIKALSPFQDQRPIYVDKEDGTRAPLADPAYRSVRAGCYPLAQVLQAYRMQDLTDKPADGLFVALYGAEGKDDKLQIEYIARNSIDQKVWREASEILKPTLPR